MKYNPLLRHFSVLTILALTTLGAGDLNVFLGVGRQPASSFQRSQDIEKVPTNLVNVDFVVYQKRDGQVITRLKKDNFAVFLDGVPKEITDFSTPDRPVTAVLLVEYSKLGTVIGINSSAGRGAVSNDLLEATGALVSKLIKRPNDYASVIAFDIRSTPITDLTNDPKRISDAVDLLLRNTPGFIESNMFDALGFVLLGGRGDPAVLDKARTQEADYSGLASVKGKRRAIILIGSGLDTFSKTNYARARKIVQDAGVPIFALGTVNPKVANSLSGNAGDQLAEAETRLKTMALETGGAFYPSPSKSEVPGLLEKINTMVSGQYSLTFSSAGIHDGKAHRIVVKVDVNGDGIYDEQDFVVQARQVYNAQKNR